LFFRLAVVLDFQCFPKAFLVVNLLVAL